METKKNPKVDLEKKRTLFVQLGILVALSIVLFAFEMKQFDRRILVLTSSMASTDLEETVIQTERQQEQLPPPPQTITTMLEIVDDHVDIMDEIDINIELTSESILQDYRPPVQREEEDDEEFIWIVVEQQASFPGGATKFYEYLSANLVYPPAARDAGIEGTVWVRFVVEIDGSITNVEIERGGLGGGTDRAAMNVVRGMPNWEPARQRNRPVRSYFILPIEFKLAR